MNKYDSAEDTYEHQSIVFNKMYDVIKILKTRAANHDNSKLEFPEKEMFDKYVPLLKSLQYGSQEYMVALEEMKKTALHHHYENNSHHPEHFNGDMDCMSLFDIVEMFCD